MPCTEELEGVPPTLAASSCGKVQSNLNDELAGTRPVSHYTFQPSSQQHSPLKSAHMYINRQANEPDRQKWGDRSANNFVQPESEYGSNGTMDGPGPSGDGNGNSLSEPCVVLYPPHLIKLQWGQVVRKIGAGLVNQGNTCYMNSVLQCLTHTPPLANYCISDEHPKTCTQKKFCLMCEFIDHIRNALQKGGSIIRPAWVNQNAKDNIIAKSFRDGRQEDAHEFLRVMVDGLQKACLNGYTKLDRLSRETTVVNQIFGGYLQSQVRCMRCSARFNTYDPYMDISLDIKDVRYLEEAFARYVKPETLDMDNAYKCERCHQKVNAQKRLSIHKASNVLTVQLKRFDFINSAAKIRRHVGFSDRLNIRPYMSQNQGEAVWYHLYGVLVHSGSDSSCGHYYCYVKAPSSAWYLMNDGSVQSVSAHQVFRDEAYVLFYLRDVSKHQNYQAPNKTTFNGSANKVWENVRFNGAGNRHGKPGPVNSPMNGAAGKYTPHGSPVNGTASSHSAQYTPVNGIGGRHPSNGSVVRDGGEFGMSASQRGAGLHAPQPSASSSPAASALPQQRKKISFDFNQKTFQPVHSQVPQTTQRKDSASSFPAKRIVMHIKNGKVTTVEKSSDGKESLVKSSPISKVPSTLVPYDVDSDSGGEGSSKKESWDSSKNGASIGGESGHQGQENGSDKSSMCAWNTRTLPDSATNVCSGVNGEHGPSEESVTGAGESERLHNTGSHDVSESDRSHANGGEALTNTEVTNNVGSQLSENGSSVPTPAPVVNGSFHCVGSEPSARNAEGKISQWDRDLFSSDVHRDIRARSGSLEKVSATVRPQKRSSSLDPVHRHTDFSSGNKDNLHIFQGSFRSTADMRDFSQSMSTPHGQTSSQNGSDVINDVDSFAQNTEDQPSDHQDSQQAPKIKLSFSSSGDKVRRKNKKKKRKKNRGRYSQIGVEDGYHQQYRKKKHRHDYDYSDCARKDRWNRQDNADYGYKVKRHSDLRYSDYDYQSSSAKRRKSESSDSEYVWEERTKESLLMEKSAVREQACDKSVRHYGRDGDWSHSSMKPEGGDRYCNGPVWNHTENREWKKGEKPWRRTEEPSWTSSHRYQNHSGPSRWREDYESQLSYSSQSYSSCPMPSLGRLHSDQNFHRNGSSHYYRDHHSHNSFNSSHYGARRNYSYQRRY